MKIHAYIISLFIFSLPCLADSIKTIETCNLKQNEKIQLISVNTIDGDTLYLNFRNIITDAYSDPGEDNSLNVGDIVLSKCINKTLIYAMNYGSPYLKGCLVSAWSEENKPESFCFAEKDLPKSIWFGKEKKLIVIINKNEISSLNGKYTIYDSSRKIGERSYYTDKLPSKVGYEIFTIK